MDLIEKYLGEGKPSLDSLKYKGKGDKKLSPDEMIKISKIMGGKSGEITANVALAMKKNDKKKVQKLVDMYPDKIMGIYDVLKWLG